VTETRKALITQPPAVPSGPLGLCNPCCAARIADPEQPLREAVTLVPATVPIAGPGGQVMGVGVVALPHCWEHIPRGTGRPGLLVANGEIPRG
jgi:hypothetical protein